MGEVVEVAGGYARNYLIPRGMAVGVTRGTMKDIAEQQKVLEVKAERLRQQVAGFAEKIAGVPLVVKARCSASGKLFGSITNRQVAAAILEATGEDVDRHKIHVDDRIRTVGTYTAMIKLHPDVEIDKEFTVEGEGFVAEEPPDEEGEQAAAAGAGAEAAPESQPAPAEEQTAEEGSPTATADEEAAEPE